MTNQPLQRSAAISLAPDLEAHRQAARKVAAVLAQSGDNYAAGAISHLLDDIEKMVAGLSELPPIYR